jgi:hypothetical protein
MEKNMIIDQDEKDAPDKEALTIVSDLLSLALFSIEMRFNQNESRNWTPF